MAEHARFEILVFDAKKSIQEISPQETAAALKRGDTLLIDVRDADEWREGHIPGAKNSVAEQSSWRSKKPCPIFQRRSLPTVAAVAAPPWPPKVCSEWATRTCNQWPAASKLGRPQAYL